MTPDDCLPAELRGAKVTPLRGGASGAAVYRVEAATGTFVLKLHHGPAEEWPGKLAIQRAAAAAGVAPTIVHVDEAQRAIVSELVVDHGFAPFYFDPSRRAVALEAIGALLRRVHALPPPAAAKVADPRKMLASMQADLAAAPAFVGEAIARALAGDVPADRAPALCHNDVNPSNLVFDGERLFLLDWDTAGVNDPLYDLATVAMFLRMDEATCLRLISAHDGTPATVVPPRFIALRRIVAAMCGAIFVRMSGAASGPETVETVLALGDFYARLRAGSVSPATPDGMRMFGLALLKESLAT